MNLIYACVFHQVSYIKLLKLLITSISVKSNINKETTDILIITNPSFQEMIKQELAEFDLPINYYLLELHSLMEAGCARLNIFSYENIGIYKNILYLDTDILVNSDINVLFNMYISPEKLYTLEEGILKDDTKSCSSFDFSNIDVNRSAFTSGILFFKRTVEIQDLFIKIQSHIAEYIYIQENPIPNCLDQPFIVYNALVDNKYDNHLMKAYFENNPTNIDPYKIIYHFPGDPGDYVSKYYKMTSFWEKMNEITNV